MVDNLAYSLKTRLSKGHVFFSLDWKIVPIHYLSAVLFSHVLKGDPVEIAFDCAMLLRRLMAINANSRYGDLFETTMSPTHRHEKRGSTYQVLGTLWLQAAKPISQDGEVVVYRDVTGGGWAREIGEFEDGRFVDLTKT